MIWHLLKKDLLRRYKNPLGFIMLVILPLVMVGLMGLVFAPSNNNNVLPKIKLLIEDRDQSFVSKLLPGAFSSGQLANLFEIIPVKINAGQDLMEKGKGSALLIIPEHFGANMFNGTNTELTLIKNPSEEFSPQIAQETISIFAEGMDRLLRIADKPVQAIRNQVKADSNPTDFQVAQVSILFNHLISKVQDYLFPPLITFEKSVADNSENGDQPINIFGYLLPGLMVLSLLFVLDNVAKDIFQERENLTLYRMQTTPLSLNHYIFSKLLSVGSIGLLAHILVWLFGAITFKIYFSWSQVLLFLLFSLVLLFSLTALMIFLYTLLRTRSQASAVVPMFIILFSMLGGSMIPVPSLPGFLQKMAVVSPVFWGVNGLQKIVLENVKLGSVMPHVSILLTIAVVLSLLSIFLLHRKLRT